MNYHLSLLISDTHTHTHTLTILVCVDTKNVTFEKRHTETKKEEKLLFGAVASININSQ